jgi:hypothetical protein
MMSDFWKWLTHQTRTGAKCPESLGEKRQAQQVLESSLRMVQRASLNSEVQQQVVSLASEDLKKSVHETIEKMRAGERAIEAAAAAVELLEVQKRQG